MTYSYALLAVSPATFAEIEGKLRAANYEHAIHDDGELDMHGIALVKLKREAVAMDRQLIDAVTPLSAPAGAALAMHAKLSEQIQILTADRDELQALGQMASERANEAEREVARLRAEVDRIRWLIHEGEKHFGSLWRQAQKSDIDYVRGSTLQSSAPSTSENRATLPGNAAEAVGGADLDFEAALANDSVPRKPLQVYNSNSWRRVGTRKGYREVLAPITQRDGHPDISNEPLLRALVAAFNAMLARRESAHG